MQPGAIIAGRWAVESLAGAGGMGTVFRARDLVSRAPVALKVLRSTGPRAARRFVQEAELLASLEHPCIVRYLAHGPLRDDSLFLAIEWIDGDSLRDVLGRRGLPVRTSLDIAHRLAGALSLVHARGIVHGDVKPSNVLLPRGADDHPKLVDFGIARHVAGDAFASAGAGVGTPAWMPPEQARGGGQIDARADVFSLGAVLFTCLTGRPPFDADPGLAVAKMMLAEAPRLRDIRPDLPPKLDDLLASMLARDPSRRPASGAAAEAALAEMRDVEGDAPAPLLAFSSLQETQGSTAAICDDSFASRERLWSCAVLGAGLRDVDAAAIVAVAARHGASLHWLGDDSFVAMTRGAGSATDRASRAAHLALDIRRAIPAARVALVTGSMDDAWSAPAGDRGLIGDAVAGVRIDRVSASLLEGRFEIAGRDDALLLTGERTAVDAPRMLLGRPTPFVGRSGELRTLEESFRDGIAEGEARATLVTGPPGIGKSRLRHELLARLRASVPALRTWVGAGDPMRFGTPFSLIAPVVRHLSGIDDADAPDVGRQKLAARVGQTITPAEEATDVSEFLGEIAGLPFPGEGRPRLIAARQSPLVMADRVREAFRTFLAAELARGPILLVLEDAHWGDLPSLRLVDQMLEAFARAPFLVLSIGRVEIEKLFPALWASRGVRRLRLAELAADDARELAREVLGARADAAVIDGVVRRAEGNAFCLEEVIRAVAEGRADELPETVLAMAQSRLDTLSSEARRVLRACSVFGDGVVHDAIAALLSPQGAPEVALRLDDLVEREVLVRRQVSGRARYSFRHALLRDGAYATFTDADRARAHLLALDWLRTDDRAEPLVLAEHAERAGDRAVATDMLLRAAREALVANDFAAAITRAARGLAHGASGSVRADLLTVQGQAYAYRNEWPKVVQNAVALELAAPGSATWCTAAAGLLWARLELNQPDEIAPILMMLRGTEPDADAGPVLASTLAIVVPLLGWLGQHVIAAGFLERLEEVAAKLSADDLLARGWLHLARAHQANFERNDTYRALIELRASVDFATRGGDRATLIPLSLGALGETLRALGRPDESERLQREVLDDTARSLEFITGFSRGYLANAQLALGELSQAAETASDIVAACGPNDRWREGAARAILARVAERRGDLDAAEDEATRSVELLDQVAFNEAGSRAARASIRLARGEVEGALSDALAAHQTLDAIGCLGAEDARVRLVCARALDASGDRARAREVLDRAVATLDRRRASIEDAALRESFEAIPEHVETRALAAAWSD
ncbi:MAG: protein kinase [Deltaproteobacteria bacterium]|nr:protein kinase [Deltaproteobacteria bacterium]